MEATFVKKNKCIFYFFFFTCVRSFGPRAALLEALAAPHLHQLSVQRVQHVPVHRVHRVGQLGEEETPQEQVMH